MKEINHAGLVVISAILIIIGASLLPTLGIYVGLMTGTESVTNNTVTTAANGEYVDLTGQELISSASVNNHTHAGSNVGVTIAEGISTVTGNKRIRMYTTNATWASKRVNVTYTYGNEGYIDDSAGRSITLLIIVFCALLIMVTAIVPIFRNGILEIVGLR